MRRLFVFGAILFTLPGLAPPATAAIPRAPRPLDPIEVERWAPSTVADRIDHTLRSVSPSTASGDVVARNFRVLGHLELPGGSPHGDVYFYDHDSDVGRFAYVGTWRPGCDGTGVKVIDVNRSSKPKLVALAGAHRGESQEDMVVHRIDGRDVLAVGLQVCGRAGRAGLLLVDVTNPRRPRELSFLPTLGLSGGVHELDVVERRDGRVLALLAVPFAECCNEFLQPRPRLLAGEFQIADITDPLRPALISDWGVRLDGSVLNQNGNDPISSTFQGLGTFPAIFAHSAHGADRGRTAYLSYWDAGVLKLDISDPTDPTLVGRTVYPIDADGNAHSLAIYDTPQGRFLLQNDEDGDPSTPMTLTSTATGSEEFAGIDEPWAPTSLSKTGRIRGAVHDAGTGCRARDYRGASGMVVLADTYDPSYRRLIPDWTVPCEIGEQVLFAARAGASAFVSNLVSPDDAWGFFGGPFREVRREAKGMPIVQISDIDDAASRIRDALAMQSAVRVTLTPNEPDLGFLRVFSERGASDVDSDGVLDFPQVGSLTAVSPETLIHNTEVLGTRSYSAWYEAGIVALDIHQPRHPTQVGQFVPEPSENFKRTFGGPFPIVWGVAIDPETGIVYASDMRSGLWIVKPTGSARA